jgi:hypothetical protein
MQFVLLLYGDPALEPAAPPAERDASLQAHRAFGRSLRDHGAMVNGGEFQPSFTARAIGMTKGDPLISDQSFAETREQLGGYYLIEAADVNAALAWATQVPAPGRAIDVRPISTYD